MIEEIEEESEEGNEEEKEVTMASLRVKYEDKINAIFEHGMLAKELALDMQKILYLLEPLKN